MSATLTILNITEDNLRDAVITIEEFYGDIDYLRQKRLKGLAKKLTKLLERD